MAILGRSSNTFTQMLTTLFGVFVLSLAVQGQNVTPQLPSYLKGDSLRFAARFDSSNSYFQRSVEEFDASNDRHQKAMALYKISLNKYSQDKPEESEQLLEQALALHRRDEHDDTSFKIKASHHRGVLAEARADYAKALDWYREGLRFADNPNVAPALRTRLLVSIADIYQSQGNYDQALQQLGEAESYYHRNHAEDKRLLGRIYNSYGMVHQSKGNWETALNYFRQSLEIDREVLPSPHPDLAKDFNNMAITYYYQSDYQRALDHMKNTVRIFSDFYGENHRLVAAGYNNIGIVYSEIDELDKATDYLEKSLKIRKNLLGNDHPDIAVSYQNLGALYYDMEQYDTAITHYKKAEALYLDNFPDGHPELANTYANLGQAYANKQTYEEALDYYNKDLDINLERLGDTHPFIGDTYTKIGETYGMAGNYEQALDFFRRAVGIFVKDGQPEVDIQNLPMEQVIYPTQLVETLQQKAGVLQEYAEKSGSLSPLEQAMQTYLQLTRLIEELQKSYRRENSKLQLRKRSTDIFKEGFATAYQLLEETGNADYKEYAFYFTEKSTGQVLLEQLQNINARQFAGVPDTLVEREYQLHKSITRLQQQLQVEEGSPQQSDSLSRLALEDSVFQARESLIRLVKQVEQDYPRYHELKYQPLTVRISDVQKDLLANNQTMVRYFFGPDALYAFVLNDDKTVLRKLAADSLLQQDVVHYRKHMRKVTSVGAFSEESYAMYARLVEPLRDYIEGQQVTVIPDGVLHQLPFESLTTHKIASDSSVRFHRLPYLVKEYAISYAPSASYLQINHQLAPSKRQQQKPFLGFAPVFDYNPATQKQRSYPYSDRPLTALPLSKHEIATLGSFFESEEWPWSTSSNQSKIYFEQEATEGVFKRSALQDYRYIHLATHAVASADDPKQSAILFAADKQQDDGVLHASEIYNLQLNAQLVTLSACKTGIGLMARGEGMMSLSRAFQYAGAQNMLASLWDVNDRSTARLMKGFYSSHVQGTPMPDALRKAKRMMIDGVQYAHPKYWAPFIFVGH